MSVHHGQKQIRDWCIVRQNEVLPCSYASVRAPNDRDGKLFVRMPITVRDPTFRFMTLDWDGRIRMDPSSTYAMRSLMAMKDQFDIALACDTDHDRHGIVTRSKGLLPPNHYLAVCVHYLFSNRPGWSKNAAIGKTVVTSTIIDRISAKLARKLYEVPVGFKFFVEGLLHRDLGFAGEESAGASFLRRNGAVWTTDKDGIIAALLAAEITAKMKKDPGELYSDLTKEYGDPLFARFCPDGSASDPPPEDISRKDHRRER